MNFVPVIVVFVPTWISFSGLGLTYDLDGRDGEGDDTCDQPGNGHVLGNIEVEFHGDHGEFTQWINLDPVNTNITLLRAFMVEHTNLI